MVQIKDFTDYGLTEAEAEILKEWSERHEEETAERALDHADEILNEAGMLEE